MDFNAPAPAVADASAPTSAAPVNRISPATTAGTKLYVEPRRTMTFWKPTADEAQNPFIFATSAWLSDKRAGVITTKSVVYVLRDFAIKDQHVDGALKFYLLPPTGLTPPVMEAIKAGIIPLWASGFIKVTKTGKEVLEYRNHLGRSSGFINRNQDALVNVNTDLFKEQEFLDYLVDKNKEIPPGLAKQPTGRTVSQSAPAPAPAAPPVPTAELAEGEVPPSETDDNIPF